MSKMTKALYIIIAVCAVIYLLLIPAASNGYGYMGHNGYHNGPSLWYWGGPDIYYERDIRNGSVSGSGMRGGGPGSGK